MAFKLIQAAQTRWGKVNAPHLVALIRPEPPSTRANCWKGRPDLPNQPRRKPRETRAECTAATPSVSPPRFDPVTHDTADHRPTCHLGPP